MVKPRPSDRERREQQEIVDRLLRDLPYADPTLSGDDAGRTAPAARADTPSARPRPAAAPPRRRALAAWLWTGLAVGVGAAVPFWPYQRDCGWQLGLYLAVVAMVSVVGLRAVRVSWRDRIGAAHAVALLAVLWGLALGAERILPRVGYAAASAGWRCSLPAMPPASPTVTPPAGEPAPVGGTDSVGT